MSYDTLYFAFFLALTWFLFRLLPWRGWVLLAASMAFYSVAGVRDSLLVTAIILANYLFQFMVQRTPRTLTIALVANFGCLAYYKYRAFLASAAGVDAFTDTIVIPLGISFYIFQLSAFLIDISRGKAVPFLSLTRFALFKLFFGQLVAGPIMRWRRFGPQINRLFDRGQARPMLIGLGLSLCTMGLFKKIVLADSIAPIVDEVFRLGPSGASVAWLGAWLFSFQIYFDFSAYSDIALGLGHLFGLRLAVNFHQPYLSRTPIAFWRHWHITLSQWIRDYLYIPLGGNRGSALRQFGVLVIVMALAGLWHGANWTFLAWGIGWALVTGIWRLFKAPLAALGPVQWALTLMLTVVLWVFFRAADMASALAYLSAMFGGGARGTAVLPDDAAGGVLILAGCAALLALHAGERLLFSRSAVRTIMRLDGAFLRAFLITVSVLLLMLPKASDTPFIYFRF